MKLKFVIAALLLSNVTVLFARIHTPRLDAFHAELRKCLDELSAARASAKDAPHDERRKLLRAAKTAYGRCETHAYQVFKYWPKQPPGDVAPAPPPAPPSTTTDSRHRVCNTCVAQEF
jgi:hypothetical protein